MPRTGRSVTNCAATRPNESKRKREGLEQRGETWLIYAAASCQLPVASYVRPRRTQMILAACVTGTQ